MGSLMGLLGEKGLLSGETCLCMQERRPIKTAAAEMETETADVENTDTR